MTTLFQTRMTMAPSPTPSHSKRLDKKKFTHVSSELISSTRAHKLPCALDCGASLSSRPTLETTADPCRILRHTIRCFPSSTMPAVLEEEIARGEHMSLAKYKYVDATGNQKIWEVAERCQKPKSHESDSVCAIPILRRMLKYDCLVLVKQYRPSMKSFTLEFPAGVVEPGDSTSEHSALRRLNSQTGYTSTGVKQVSPLTASDPVHTACTTKLVSLDVNGDDLRNLNAQQRFGEGEFYEVVQVPMNDVLQRLNDYSEEGYVIDSRVYTFALGLTMGLKMGAERNGVKDDDVQIVTNIIDH